MSLLDTLLPPLPVGRTIRVLLFQATSKATTQKVISIMDSIEVVGRHAGRGAPKFHVNEISPRLFLPTQEAHIRIGQGNCPEFWIEIRISACQIITWALDLQEDLDRRLAGLAEEDIDMNTRWTLATEEVDHVE